MCMYVCMSYAMKFQVARGLAEMSGCRSLSSLQANLLRQDASWFSWFDADAGVSQNFSSSWVSSVRLGRISCLVLRFLEDREVLDTRESWRVIRSDLNPGIWNMDLCKV